ncbi:MAG: carbohydrate-binding family 9-like protein [Deltaproteobacteria bacterium]|nr:carbohydrate-binding family 9-like protein [Deltaproteobacteria bacterium]
MSRLRWVAFGVLAVFAAGCVEQESERGPTEEDLKVIKQNILAAPPAIKHKVNAELDGKITYLGVDVDKDEVTPGQPFTLTHYWKVEKAAPDWKLFVHINDPSKKKFINADHKAIGNRYAVAQWKPGEIIRDAHTVTLPNDWGASQVEVYTGLWKGKDRMKVVKGAQDKEGRILAVTLPVKGGKAPAPAPVKRLVAAKATKPVKLDGKLDDEVWKKAVSSGLFVDTMTGGAVPIATEAKVAYDDKYLYVAFDCKDEDVWSDFKKRDDHLWTQEAVEIFLDANNDGKDYIELQVNPHGTIFDSYLPEYRKNQNDWDGKLKAKVAVDGTATKRGDKDKGWTVEVAIPWEDAKGRGKYELKVPPKAGDSWKINFFRMDKPEKGGQIAAGWSPPLVPDFHKLDRFGDLVFGDAEGKAPEAAKAEVKPEAKPEGATPAAEGRPAGKVVRMAETPGERGILNRSIRAPLSATKRIPRDKPAK